MKFDGDEEYKDPDEAEFAPIEEEDEFLEDDLLADDVLADDDGLEDDDDEEDEAELDVI